MSKENPLDKIFTDYDESIFSDGSIDPMGLRIIWTSIGSKIFHNKLNTVSTDIKLYTLNLFHHYIIQKCVNDDENSLNKLIRKKPYYNKSGLFEGLIIFLENLLIHATYYAENSSLMVPGKNKLINLKRNENKKKDIEKIIIGRDKGILIRQYLLGIHGRHKGPFQQMGVLNENPEDIYNNPNIWKETADLFNSKPWEEAAELLTDLIKNKVFKSNTRSGSFIEYKIDEVLTEDMQKKYIALLNKSIYSKDNIRTFWLNRLGLNQGTAGLLYSEYLNQNGQENHFQNILIQANKNNNDKLLGAITSIEPFLTLIDKCINRILSIKTKDIDNDLKKFIDNWLKQNEVNENKIKSYLSIDYLNQEAINRLSKLLEIYIAAKNDKKPAENFIIHIIQYHQDIMKLRGNLTWVSIGLDNKISVNRPNNISEQYLKHLESKEWVNSYYLPTVHSLHKGLVNETA